MTESIALADLLPEPPDGTRLIVDCNGIYEVFAREDEASKQVAEYDDERWLNLSTADMEPCTWRRVLAYARTVYALGEVLATTEEDR